MVGMELRGIALQILFRHRLMRYVFNFLVEVTLKLLFLKKTLLSGILSKFRPLFVLYSPSRILPKICI